MSRMRTKNGTSPSSAAPVFGTVCFDPATLRKRLTPLQHQITQDKATEKAFSGRFYKHREPGIYRCIVCRQDLFSSATKYDSGSGWPSFFDVLDHRRITLKPDLSHVGGNLLLLVANPDMARTEVSCARCGAHLGHVFDDGPKPTGRRYCVNSESLDFRRDESIDLPDGKLEFPRGSCGLGGSCAPPARRTTPAISRVVEKLSSLDVAAGGAGGASGKTSAVNGHRVKRNGHAEIDGSAVNGEA